MRSVPQRGDYTPTEAQLLQRERFKTVVEFLTPIKGILSNYFGKPQGDKSRYNLATSYHLKEALTEIPGGFEINYTKVLISKGDVQGIDTPNVVAAANQVINVTWVDNSGQGNANPLDQLLVVFYVPTLKVFQIYENQSDREQEDAQITLPAFLAGLDVQIWATFISASVSKDAALSSYLGTVTVS